jgi:hypothetical protein
MINQTVGENRKIFPRFKKVARRMQIVRKIRKIRKKTRKGVKKRVVASENVNFLYKKV